MFLKQGYIVPVMNNAIYDIAEEYIKFQVVGKTVQMPYCIVWFKEYKTKNPMDSYYQIQKLCWERISGADEKCTFQGRAQREV